jgi:predicted O-methyltransferase YrrM
MPDFLLVVINDGAEGDPESDTWAPLADITDPRLVRFNLPFNRGRYFADAVVLEAAATQWFAPHDADDEADPRWLEAMLEAARPGAAWVATAQRVEMATGAFAIEQPKASAPRATLTHYAHMAGLWSTEWLRETAGGPHPGYRVAYDTLLSMIARTWGSGVVIDTPLYTRHRRADSLTLSPETGMRSAHRREARSSLTDLWQEIRALPVGGFVTPRDVIRRLNRKDKDLWNEIATQADRLSEEISRRTASARFSSIAESVEAPQFPGWQPAPMITQTAPGEFTRVAAHPAMAITTTVHRWVAAYSLGRAAGAELDRFLSWRRPMRIVEFGSGVSTLVLAAHAKATGAQLAVYEHLPRYAERTAAMLRDLGLWDESIMRVVPLVPGETGPTYARDGRPLPFAEIDFALIDGPPEGEGGRREVIRDLWPILHPAGRAWLDDAARPGEIKGIDDWIQLGGDAIRHEWGGRHVAELLKDDILTPWRTEPPGGPVVITLLTGGRPVQLAETLAGLYELRDHPDVSIEVVLNGAVDGGASRAFLVDQLDEGYLGVHDTDRPLKIGEGVVKCAQIARDSGAEYWLHLEDDWTLDTADPWWLHRAIGVLVARPGISQVRLRHIGEQTLPHHMLTKRRIQWRADEQVGALYATEAHWTFNPSLVRTADVAPLFIRAELAGERHAQQLTHDDGLRGIAQLYPGAFRHIGGGGRSLADRTGGR